MLLNSLYEIENIQHSSTELKVEIRFHADHPLYAGHFPGQPVTPGVVQTEIVKELIEKARGEKLEMASLRQIKFLAAHDPAKVPGMHILVNWTDELVVQATGSAAGVTYFKLSAIYRLSNPVI